MTGERWCAQKFGKFKRDCGTPDLAPADRSILPTPFPPPAMEVRSTASTTGVALRACAGLLGGGTDG